MIAMYCDTQDMRQRIEGLLTGVELRSAERPDGFKDLLQGAAVGIAGMERCSDEDVHWLRGSFALGPSGPSCIVVTPLSLTRLQRLRAIESSRLHVVWAEEVNERLGMILDRIDPAHLNPLQHLGRHLVRDYSLHESLAKAIRQIAKLSDEPEFDPPKNSVSELAAYAGVAPDAFRRYWREQLPLRCRPKELLNWALLIWGIRRRSAVSWAKIADAAGVRRRTLERAAVRLAGCTLATAARHPDLVRRRFNEWVATVSLPRMPRVRS